MKSHISKHKLFNLGEYGLGNVVLLIKSGNKHDLGVLSRLDSKDKSKKIVAYQLDLTDDTQTIQRNFINTLNEFSFVTTLILDFPSFCLFVKNHARIKLAHEGLHKLILFNPVNPKINFLQKIFGKSYKTISSETFKPTEYDWKNMENVVRNIHLVRANMVDLISYSDKQFNLTLASQINNSKIYDLHNDYEIINVLNGLTTANG